MLVPDLDADLIRVFSISDSYKLIPSSTLALPLGSGPRHGAFVVPDEGCVFLYVLPQISNMLIGFKVSYEKNGTLGFEKVGTTNLLKKMNESLVVMGPNTQNASELYVSVRFLLVSLRDVPLSQFLHLWRLSRL